MGEGRNSELISRSACVLIVPSRAVLASNSITAQRLDTNI
jgi:hypothetical protein